MSAYYNEIDPQAAAWLRELIRQGHIAPGVVDERDIRDVRPDELREFTQCHFFAGIGVWSYALRQAGWPNDRPVWTGSPPCQPFSSAGRRGGVADERHLWPHYHHLIGQCCPPVLFGEQVSSKDGLAWFDLVQADLENTGYAAGALDTCAAGVGAPHIRQRLYFFAERVVDAGLEGLEGLRGGHRAEEGQRQAAVRPATEAGESGGMADTDDRMHNAFLRGESNDSTKDLRGCAAGGPQRPLAGGHQGEPGRVREPTERTTGPTNGYWRDADWLYCRDGKWRPVEPGTFPLADGAPARVGRLRGYGNAIVAQVAQEVVASYLDIEAEGRLLGLDLI